MIALKYNTASQELPLGPFLDSTDGNTAETGLTIANTDILLFKTGATGTVSKNSGGATHDTGGIYYCTLDATDTNTLGPLTIFVHVAGALAVKVQCCVYPAIVYDALIAGTDYLNVDTVQMLGATTLLGYIDTTISSRSSHSASDVWSVATRTLTSFGSLVSDITTSVWSAGTRTLTSFGTLISDIWEYATRTLTSFAFSVTASNVTDKTGYSISGTKTTLDDLNDFNPSSDIVSHVTLVDTTTTNTDMRGTDGANTVEPDNTSITSIKTKTDQLTFTVTNKVDATADIEGGDATAANQTLILESLTSAKGVTFDTSTDSLEAIRNRGDSSWTTGGGLSGSNTITLTIKDDITSANILEAAVEIWDSAGTTFYERKNSNSSGQAVYSMDDGTYTIKIHKAGYTFDNQTLVVSGNASETYTGTSFVIPTPSDATLCRLYTTVRTSDGNYPTSVSAILNIVTLPYEVDGVYYKNNTLTGTYNSETGLLYFDVIRLATVTITISNYGIANQITVPDLSSQNISDLII